MAVLDPKGLLDTVTEETASAFMDLADSFAEAADLDLRVRSGARTCAEQREIYAKGRSAGGTIETYADGCRSWHVLAMAVDADVIDPRTGKAAYDCLTYQRAGEIWEAMGGVWGGRFRGFGACGDAGHFEWHPGLKMADICPDPNDCEAAVIRARELQAPPVKMGMVIAGVALIGTGLAAAYFLTRS